MSDYILIVDDNDDSRDILGVSLETVGHTVKYAEGGKQALELIDQDLPILIVTDIMMPDMNGFALLTELKRKPEASNIPVIVISATGDSIVLQQHLKGVSRVFQKGKFSSQKFQEAVAEVLQESGS